jgi:Carboxypeptidase regulatory-like domain/TonB dependent receptor
MRRLQFCLVVFAVLALACSAFAQVQNGQFTGTVIDPTGAAIANAKVTVTNLGTNLSASVTTNSSGGYVVKELPVGAYKLVAEAPGFKTVSNTNVTLNAGTIAHVDFKMTMGQAREVVEVSGEVTQVDIEDSKLANTVTSTLVANLPLNGRNIYDLMKLSPGAVDNGVGGDTTAEAGPTTIVNGTRQNFNGFLINGVANKDLSGGPNNTPIQDSIQEFQELTLNMSAQYGNSAGSITNLITKSGTNSFHGSAWEFLRNDALDANNFFLNHNDVKRPPLRFNQFGATFGGPIMKDKLFFFASYQGDRFKTVQPPTPIQQESPEWRTTVGAFAPDSVANLLYSNFAPTTPGTTPTSLNEYSGGDFTNWLCPDNNSPALAARFQSLLGVTAADVANAAAASCSTPLTQMPSAVNLDRDAAFLQSSVITFPSQTVGNLFNGNEASLRLDYNPNERNRFFASFNWLKSNDSFGPFNASFSSARGFLSPQKSLFPNFQFSYVRTFSPKILNEFKAGYTLNKTFTGAGDPGVPQVYFVDGSAGFGSYNGYPQFFKDHVYSYSDMISISHGNHNMKAGVDFRRNIENSEFNVGRPSYYFFDQLYFALDAPFRENAGVDPGIISGNPAELATNKRHWRNLEFGAYFQDDWKVSRRLTLNLGLRYDLYTRHTEENGLVTNYILGPGQSFIDNLQTGAGQVHDASVPCLFLPGNILNKAHSVKGTVGCGPDGGPSVGGFAVAKALGLGDHNNFGPRVGFAYDVFGNGKTALRGGFGLSYEGTLYNPLSNSRWNAPFYSFDQATNFLDLGIADVVYGPTTCGIGLGSCAPSGQTATFTGAPTNPGEGTGVQATGNIVGWAPDNPHLSFRSGLIFPSGIRDPYVYSYFLGFQHELINRMVLEVNYVGTTGHKLFRSQDINRIPGGKLPVGGCVTDNFGRQICGQVNNALYPGTTIKTNPLGTLNPNFGQLRAWMNVNNSNYNSLQASLKMQSIHGVTFNLSYTYSHSIDNGSAWHNSATTGNGAGAGDGYSLDVTQPGLDRGNSTFDIRHRLVANYVYELPLARSATGVLAAIAKGWQWNGILSLQTGAHWEPFRSSAAKLREISDPSSPCTADDVNNGNCENLGGDYNLDNTPNDRPDSNMKNFHPSTAQWADGWFNADGPTPPQFTSPCLGCTGNLGRNTFTGPYFFNMDMSMFKNFRVTEKVGVQFRVESFNLFNRTNFKLPGANFAGQNKINSGAFGGASGAFDPRTLQFGLKISF